MVNRWNKAIAVGLRHNHDISFIATQYKTMAIVFYATKYATKVENPVWKRVAAAAEIFHVFNEVIVEEQADAAHGVSDDDGSRHNKTRQFLKVANRIFTETCCRKEKWLPICWVILVVVEVCACLDKLD
jgi:3D (Asp-Asp-Asp) domain-containing protein